MTLLDETKTKKKVNYRHTAKNFKSVTHEKFAA